MANALGGNGYAVLRTDDRGVGNTSGEYESTTIADFAQDALEAVAYLKTRKDISIKIGLMGHSEGGMAIAITGAKRKNIAVLISLSGLAMGGYQSLIQQNNDLVARSKMDDCR